MEAKQTLNTQCKNEQKEQHIDNTKFTSNDW